MNLGYDNLMNRERWCEPTTDGAAFAPTEGEGSTDNTNILSV